MSALGAHWRVCVFKWQWPVAGIVAASIGVAMWQIVAVWQHVSACVAIIRIRIIKPNKRAIT